MEIAFESQKPCYSTMGNRQSAIKIFNPRTTGDMIGRARMQVVGEKFEYMMKYFTCARWLIAPYT